jgi:hypothetical protein
MVKFKLKVSFVFAYSVHTSQETHYVSATMPNRLMLLEETVAVYCDHMEHSEWVNLRPTVSRPVCPGVRNALLNTSNI